MRAIGCRGRRGKHVKGEDDEIIDIDTRAATYVGGSQDRRRRCILDHPADKINQIANVWSDAIVVDIGAQIVTGVAHTITVAVLLGWVENVRTVIFITGVRWETRIAITVTIEVSAGVATVANAILVGPNRKVNGYNQAFKATLTEFGVEPHRIEPRRRNKHKALLVDGWNWSRTVNHPGFRGRKWMAKAFAANSAGINEGFYQGLAKHLGKLKQRGQA